MLDKGTDKLWQRQCGSYLGSWNDSCLFSIYSFLCNLKDPFSKLHHIKFSHDSEGALPRFHEWASNVGLVEQAAVATAATVSQMSVPPSVLQYNLFHMVYQRK